MAYAMCIKVTIQKKITQSSSQVWRIEPPRMAAYNHILVEAQLVVTLDTHPMYRRDINARTDGKNVHKP